MKRISKIYAVLFAFVAAFLMALPVSAVSAQKDASAVNLVTASKTVNVSKCKINVAKTATYTGKSIKPKVTVKYGSKTLKSGKHYKVSYSSNKKIGTAKITITGIKKNGYTGKKTVSFKIVPAKPVVSVKSKTTKTVTLSWKKVSGATKYYVYRYDSAKKKYVKLGSTSKTTYTAKNLTSAKYYTFVVKSYAKKNYLSDYSKKKSTYTLPAAVSNLKASVTETSATLSWKKVTNATGYIVYKYDANSKKYTKVGSTKNLTYKLNSLKETTNYQYAVAAYVKSSSYIGAKTNVSFTTLTFPPAKVKNIKVTLNDNIATVTWDKTEKAEGYTIYSYNEMTGEFTELATVKGTETYSCEIQEGVTSFVVSAYLTSKNLPSYGDYSDTSSVGIPFTAVKNLRALSSTAPSVELVWDNKDGAEGYDIYTYNADTGEYTYLLDAGSENTVKISGVEADKVYSYAVCAYYTINGKKTSGEYSEVAEANTSFGASTSVKAVAYSDTTINLKWNIIKGATSYNVYEYDFETGDYKFLDNIAYSTYTVKNCEAEKTYRFAITGVRHVDENTYESIMTASADVYYTNTAPSNLKKTYNIFKSGTFGITYAIPYDGGNDISTETYVKKGNFLLVANMDIEGLSLTAKTLYLKDKNEGYIIVPFGVTGFYSKLNKEDLEGDGMSADSMISTMAPDINEDIPYTVEIKKYNGQLCSCEGYVAKTGKTVFYYFNNGKLVGMEEILTDGSSSVTKVTAMSATVDDKNFKLPTLFPVGWTDLGNLDL